MGFFTAGIFLIFTKKKYIDNGIGNGNFHPPNQGTS